jgi:hypothetical protein
VEKDAHFDGLLCYAVDLDSFNYISQQTCHRTVALGCVVLCSYMGRVPILTVSVMLSSNIATVQVGHAVFSCAVIL